MSPYNALCCDIFSCSDLPLLKKSKTQIDLNRTEHTLKSQQMLIELLFLFCFALIKTNLSMKKQQPLNEKTMKKLLAAVIKTRGTYLSSATLLT